MFFSFSYILYAKIENFVKTDFPEAKKTDTKLFFNFSMALNLLIRSGFNLLMFFSSSVVMKDFNVKSNQSFALLCRTQLETVAKTKAWEKNPKSLYFL